MPEVYSRIDGLTNLDYQEFIVSSMIAAGWVDVSSSKAKDGYVLHSSGEDGTLDMYVGIKTYKTDVAHTSYIRISMGMKYTPGATGTAGTWSVSMSDGYGVRNVYTEDQSESSRFTNYEPLPTYYSVNKDRAIFVRSHETYQFRSGTGDMYGSTGILGIGKPILYYKPVGGRCMSLWGTGCSSLLNAAVVMASTPGSDTGGAVQIGTFDTLYNMPRHSPDDTAVPLSKVYFGDATNGIMGEIEMVRSVNNCASAGDILTDGVYKYKVVMMRPDRSALVSSIFTYAIPIEKIVT